MRPLPYLLFTVIFAGIEAIAQIEVYRTDKLKLAISFGNHVEMAFDKVERKRQVLWNKEDLAEEVEKRLDNGDFLFYQGKPNLAIRQYHKAFERLLHKNPAKAKGQPIDVFTLSRFLDKRFTTAEKLLKRVDQAELSKDQWLLLARAINSTGIYYHHVGNIKVAEKLYTKALQIRGEQAGKTSEYYVSTLHNLAVLRKDQGRYDAAEDMLKYVIRFYNQKRFAGSHLHAIATNNQAMLYAHLGRIEEAVTSIDKVMEPSEGIDFPSHSLDRARMITNMALLEIENGNLKEASDLLDKAIRIYKEKEKTKHPDYHQIQLLRARLQLVQGNLTSLHDLVENALEEISDDVGTDNLVYAHALEVKAEYLFAIKDYGQANSTYNQIAEIRKLRLGTLHQDYLRVLNKTAICQWKMGSGLSAFEIFKVVANSYLEVVDKFFYNMSESEKTSFWQNMKPELDAFYSFVLHNHDASAGILQFAYDLRLKTKGLLLYNTSAIRDAIYSHPDEDLSGKYENWLANKEVLSAYYSMEKEAIDLMGADVGELELENNELEKEINRSVALLNSDVENVTSLDVAKSLGQSQAAIEIIRIDNSHGTEIIKDQFCALILKPSGTIDFTIIGEAVELETRMASYYKNAIKSKIEETLTYEKYWLPIEESMAGVEHVYVSLDGVYNLINLNSLRDPSGKYVIDKLQIEVVPNTGVLIGKSKVRSSNKDFVLVGNPLFGNESISPLPGTAKEISSIADLVIGGTTIILEGERATEEALKEVERPKVLHVATHGFFMKDVDQPSNLGLSRSVAASSPLMRSGLLLTGAGESISQKDRVSDGILTAYEAMNMNLQNTDLVVLSACETGSGEIVNGEGVYGLSRAFSIAGARNLVMSLWKVDDTATQELMTLFYENWLKTGNLKSSFASAQKHLKAKYEHPYYWAAFVLVAVE